MTLPEFGHRKLCLMQRLRRARISHKGLRAIPSRQDRPSASRNGSGSKCIVMTSASRSGARCPELNAPGGSAWYCDGLIDYATADCNDRTSREDATKRGSRAAMQVVATQRYPPRDKVAKTPFMVCEHGNGRQSAPRFARMRLVCCSALRAGCAVVGYLESLGRKLEIAWEGWRVRYDKLFCGGRCSSCISALRR